MDLKQSLLKSLLLGLSLVVLLYACHIESDKSRQRETSNAETYEEEKSYSEEALEEELADTEMEEEAEGLPNKHNGNLNVPENQARTIQENPFVSVAKKPLSTFSIDVDNASYSNVRNYLKNNQLPPPEVVRIEEMINYFDYSYPQPKGQSPFTVNTEISTCPWNGKHKLVHIGLQGKKLNYANLKPSNLVFLIDASGSMEDINKLPLLKKSLKLLLNQLGSKDKIAIVAYAGAAGLVLSSTPATQKSKIMRALNSLEAGGSTAGGEGIELAYKIAEENLIRGGNNRVILATDGDFNVGLSSTAELVSYIEQKRQKDIYLTICGFGMGNYKDYSMEAISNAGNGNYFYIDNIKEARKVFVKEMRANMFTIAKDVKIQIEFNPTKVKSYRLIGYENRALANRDFDDDTKDAGELGAGHTVTALYEIVPATKNSLASTENRLKYQQTTVSEKAFRTNEIMQVKLRYKPPKASISKLITKPILDKNISINATSENFRFATAVAGFGLLLRNSKYKGNLSYSKVLKIAKTAKGKDSEGYRAEFISLVETVKLLQ